MIVNKTLLFCCLLCFGTLLSAQHASITGTLRDAVTNEVLPGVKVQLKNHSTSTQTNEEGVFRLDKLPEGKQTLTFTRFDLEITNIPVVLTNHETLLLSNLPVRYAVSQVYSTTASSTETIAVREETIPTISLSDSDFSDELAEENISALLSASRDAFSSAAAFNFSAFRFAIRGYNSAQTDVLVNGVRMNNTETGGVFWSTWGGLNDMFRNRDAKIGLSATDYTLGGVGGTTSMDIRASKQRAQTRVAYASANRSYRHRLMATHSTGMLPSGWAWSVSASRRWAQESYQPGTFYDAYSYFLGIERQVNEQHSISFTALGAPNKRGRAFSSTQEMYDLAGTNYYNSAWGYQEGEKRNASVANSHQPLFILRHDWKINDQSTLTTAGSYQFGKYGSTRLNWFDAPDPRPDYYRNLPSYYDEEQSEIANDLADRLRNDEHARQLNWTQFYEVNRNNYDEIEDANGITGNTVTGNRSQYVLEESIFDSKNAKFNAIYQNLVNENLTLNAGLTYEWLQSDNYKQLNDLLGGDYFVDLDRFAERDFPDNPDAQQSNLETPNRILAEGDKFGFDYTNNTQKGGLWAQAQWSFKKLDFFAGASVNQTSFFRTGHYRNGRFPDTSLGQGETQNFTNYATKAGLTYKIDGRNYAFANATYRTDAPFFRNAYVSPRTRNQLVPNLTNSTTYGGELGYYFRSPKLKARATAYYTQFEDETRVIRFYNDFQRAFGNYILTNFDHLHFGTELSLEAKLTSSLTVNAVASIGQYTLNSRPESLIVLDNADATDKATGSTVYLDNFYIAGTPQSAYSLGLNYRSPKFWFASLNFSHLHRAYSDFNPERRTADAVFGITDSETLNNIVAQEELAAVQSIDLFAGKSFKMGDNYFIFLTLGVNNLLDRQDMIRTGQEQLRFDLQDRDLDKFPSRYNYALGRNYFANITLKF